MKPNINIKLIGIVLLVVAVLIIASVSKHSSPSVSTDMTPAEAGTGAPQSEQTDQATKPKSPSKAVATPSRTLTTGVPKEIMLDLSTQFAKDYKVELSAFLKKPADFNGHYVVAKWNCGTDCKLAAVIDKANGKVYIAPTDNYSNVTPSPDFVPYNIGSHTYKIVNDDTVEVYSFEGGKFILVNIEKL